MTPEADDPRVQEGVDHLQRAAREMIAASRAFLDVVEELVERPDAVGDLVALVGELGGRVRRSGFAAGGPPFEAPDDDPGGDDPDGDGPDDGPIQKIAVS